jgi:hypothetical protein
MKNLISMVPKNSETSDAHYTLLSTLAALAAASPLSRLVLIVAMKHVQCVDDHLLHKNVQLGT